MRRCSSSVIEQVILISPEDFSNQKVACGDNRNQCSCSGRAHLLIRGIQHPGPFPPNFVCRQPDEVQQPVFRSRQMLRGSAGPDGLGSRDIQCSGKARLHRVSPFLMDDTSIFNLVNQRIWSCPSAWGRNDIMLSLLHS